MSAVPNSKIASFSMTEAEVAALLSVSADYLYRLRSGRIPAHRNPPPPIRHFHLGGTVRYRLADVEKWVEQQADATMIPVKRGRPTKADAARRREAQAQAESNLAA